MLIIGCDYHPSVQQIAWVDTETGECGERRLTHSGGEAEQFYRELKKKGIREAGGDYVYLRRGLGSLWGFLFGWMTVLIQRPASAATIAAGLLRLAGFIFP